MKRKRAGRSAAAFAARVALAVACAAPAAAEDEAEGLARCASVEASDARLACYDALAGRDAEPPKSPEAGFGLPAPEPPEEIGEIRSTLIAAKSQPLGGVRIELSNGQIWELRGVDHLYLKRGEEFPVVIERGSLGSYLLHIAGRAHRAVRVR